MVKVIQGIDRIVDFLYGEQQSGYNTFDSNKINWLNIKSGDSKRLKIITHLNDIIFSEFHFVEGIGFVTCLKKGTKGNCIVCDEFGKSTKRILLNVYDYDERRIKAILMNFYTFRKLQKIIEVHGSLRNDIIYSRNGTGLDTKYTLEYQKESFFSKIDKDAIIDEGYMKIEKVFEKLNKSDAEMREFIFDKQKRIIEENREEIEGIKEGKEIRERKKEREFRTRYNDEERSFGNSIEDKFKNLKKLEKLSL